MRRAVILFAICIFLLSASSVVAQDFDCDLAHQEECGDFNHNGVVDTADLIRLINIFEGTVRLDSLPKYLDELDCDCDNLHLTVSDFFAIFTRMFNGYSGWMRGEQLFSETDIISIPAVEAFAGDEIEIPLYVVTDRDLIGLQSYIRYDSDLITVTDFEFSEVIMNSTHSWYLVEDGISLYFLSNQDVDFNGFVGNLRAIVSPDAPIGSEMLLAFSNDPHRALYTGLADADHPDQSRIIGLHFIHPVKNDGIITVVEGRIINDDENTFLDFSASPNPFNNSTNLTFQIEQQAQVRIDIYDMLGRRVNTLLDENLRPGDHSVVWNADQLPSGVYFCRLAANDHSVTKRITMLK